MKSHTCQIGPVLVSVDESVRIYDFTPGKCDWGGCTEAATHFVVTVIAGIEIRPLCERHADMSVMVGSRSFGVAAVPAIYR